MYIVVYIILHGSAKCKHLHITLKLLSLQNIFVNTSPRESFKLVQPVSLLIVAHRWVGMDIEEGNNTPKRFKGEGKFDRNLSAS